MLIDCLTVALLTLSNFALLNSTVLTNHPDLAIDIQKYLHSSLAPKTFQVYLSKFRIFLRFLQQHPECRTTPFSESTFVVYATVRARKVSAACIRADFSAIASILSFARISLVWNKHAMPLLHRLLNGIERHQANHPISPTVDTLQPITIDILSTLLQHLPDSTPECQLFRAILTLGTLTGLRPGELLAYSQTDIGKAARWNQLQLCPSIQNPIFLIFYLSLGSKTSSFAHSERVQTPNNPYPQPSAVREIAKWALTSHMVTF